MNMRSVLFCNLPYAIAMLNPLAEELDHRAYEYLWYIPPGFDLSLLPKKVNYTQSIKKLYDYKPEAIFVPGNDVPWYLSGVKTQIFHGMAGEKKGHFRIRHYFDLYLTQGPYFTERFEALANKHKNFTVIETGWAKLDLLFSIVDKSAVTRNIFSDYKNQKILLYAPTFSPSLCSAEDLKNHLKALSENTDIKIIIKFHDKMDKNIISAYQEIENENLKISNKKNIIDLLKISDAMLSDTSSVVYEYLLLGKPVFTYKSNAKKIFWKDSHNPDELFGIIKKDFNSNFSDFVSDQFVKSYHPYQDGLSAKRCVDALIDYIEKNGVPKQRKLSLHRKYKLYKKFKYLPEYKYWF